MVQSLALAETRRRFGSRFSTWPMTCRQPKLARKLTLVPKK
jgi:hypothetical protein